MPGTDGRPALRIIRLVAAMPLRWMRLNRDSRMPCAILINLFPPAKKSPPYLNRISSAGAGYGESRRLARIFPEARYIKMS